MPQADVTRVPISTNGEAANAVVIADEHASHSPEACLHKEADMKSLTFVACVLTGTAAILCVAELVGAHRAPQTVRS